MAGGLFILAAILWMMKKRQELLKTEEPLSYVDDDIYSMGEFDVTDKSCSLKDETRSLSIETVKAQG